MRLAFLLLFAASAPLAAQGAIGGTVVGTDNRPIESASVAAASAARSAPRETITDGQGRFILAGLAPGTYTVTVRKVGLRSAELAGVRVAEGQTRSLSVTLTQAPRQLSTIHVVTSPTSVDASTPELTMRLDREYTALLPSARTSSSLIALVPGARKDQLWGGAPGVSNNYQLDGVAMNHPGIGGDLLSLSVDWIEALDVRGLGAGAEHGDFQGGIINALTKTGSNDRRYALRTNYESPALTASNFNLGEEGVEQAGRRELSGEALGPLARDRLFYFVAGQYVSRDMRSPNLASAAPRDFQEFNEQQTDARAIGKVTWVPALGQRVDLLAGYSGYGIEHAGINGVDAPTATVRVSRPTGYYGLSWSNAGGGANQIELKVAGFHARESRSGYEGSAVPGVHVLQPGRQPRLQNAEFNELRVPRSLSASAQWRTRRHFLTDHELAVGGEMTRGWWRDEHTRNGGLTWRPYPTFDGAPFDPSDHSTWRTVGSDWGGEIRFNSDVSSRALFVQDEFSLGPRVMLSPGIRFGQWNGFARPFCDAATSIRCYRFEAVRSSGFDPRIGVAWDVTGRNTFAVKAHWGRYHQGMHALFFDRASGVDAYTNQRFYYGAPPLDSSRQTFTPQQRDAPGSGFSDSYSESILNASGRVDGYKQPYVDQTTLAVEKSFGAAWKAEVVYTHRRNGDIVGLLDRNLATNYTPMRNIRVEHRLIRGLVLDPDGERLVLPELYVANIALQDYLRALNGRRQFPATLFGYDTAYIRALTWRPDVVLSAVPAARREYHQVTMLLRTVQRRWRAEGSLTGAQLKGNVPGVTGYGTTGTRFSAGPFVNRNEAINSDGYLPDALQMEGKVWLTARLPRGLEGGLVYTHILGERFAPSFELLGQYTYLDSAFRVLPSAIFNQVYGQSILLEPRGSRHYASRGTVDAHLAWRTPRRFALTIDLFNVLGEDELVSVKTTIQDQWPADPSTHFGSPRLRVSPRTLRVGLRVE